MQLSRAEMIALEKLQREKERRERPLMIKTKDAKLVPLVLNKAQLYVQARLDEQKKRIGRVRAVIIKGRQQGVSTYIASRFYKNVSSNANVEAFIFSHSADTSDTLFNMSKRFHDATPLEDRPPLEKSNERQLRFKGLDSGYKVATAGAKEVGRGNMIHLLHGSEMAFWEKQDMHSASLEETVPNADGTEIIYESTVNRFGDAFHRMVNTGLTGKRIMEKDGHRFEVQSDFQTIFVPWYWQDEYTRAIGPEGFDATPEELEMLGIYGKDGLTREHLLWRRYKVADKGDPFIVTREYPSNPQEAFMRESEFQLIPIKHIMLARSREPYQCHHEPLVIGIDPARLGGDSPAFCFRQGRNIPFYGSFPKSDLVLLASRIELMIVEHKPVKVFIDCGGLGVGVFDMLVAKGYANIVVKVDFGGASAYDKFKDKRAEMYGTARDMFRDGLHINDKFDAGLAERLQSELCSVEVVSDQKLIIKSKKDMRKDGFASPDLADAFVLTYAQPVTSFTIQNHNAMLQQQNRQRNGGGYGRL